MTAQQPIFKIFYNQKNISKEISQFVTSVTYTDKMTGETDELEINLEDSDGRWMADWYPGKGDKLKLQMGYDDSLLDCGEFEIDQIEMSGPPSTVVIRGMATWVTSAIRTRKSRANDGQTINDIASKIAKDNGFELIGFIPTIRIARSNQYRETDLGYLNRLGDEYGFAFNVRGKKLIFTSLFDIEDRRQVLEIDVTELMDYSFKDKVTQLVQRAVVVYQNPKTGQKVETDVKANQDQIDFTYIKDVAKIYSKTEDKSQAEQKAKALLHKYNTLQQEGTITIPGYSLCVAGNNILVTGLGVISGKYHIMSSTHTINKNGGYTTSLEIKRIGFVEKAKQAPKKKKKETTYRVVNDSTIGQ